MTTLDKKARNRLTKYGITVEEYERQELLGNAWCCGCKRFLAKDLFAPSTLNKSNGRICRECRKTYGHDYHVNNKDRTNERQREYYAGRRELIGQKNKEYRNNLPKEERQTRSFRQRLKARFGITPEQYDAILERQGGRCIICKGVQMNRRLPVDHDHKCCPGRKSCGKCLRGVICARCNMLVGILEENADLIPACEAYLNGNSGIKGTP